MNISNIMVKIKVESVACYLCKKTGQIRIMNAAGIIRFKACTRCKGIGKLFAKVDSKEWIKGKKIGATGLWNHDIVRLSRR